MKIRHLSCGTMCPVGGRLLPRVVPRRAICHCLLVEAPDGLVLIDTGLGTLDMVDPVRRLGRIALLIGPQRDPTAPAIAQVRALGASPTDVRHIVVTHLDLDHAGGLPDFPEATVHVLRAELDAVTRPSPRDRFRYRPAHMAHGPRWQLHDIGGGEPWFGFDAVRELPGLPPEILLVPLIGHSRGHAGVAVQTEDGWLLHAGDAYYDHRQLRDGAMSPALRLFEAAADHDHRRARDNIVRLRRLREEHGASVRVFCAHDPTELEREG